MQMNKLIHIQHNETGFFGFIWKHLFESGVSYDAYTVSSVLPQFGEDPFSHFRKQCDKYNEISVFMIYFLSELDERERLQSNSLIRCRNKLYELVIISMDNFNCRYFISS